MIRVEQLTIRYADRGILRDISFDAVDGEILVVIGPNGAGKTTLIKALNGAVPPAEGTVTIDGMRLSSMSRREVAKRVAVVAQENETKFPITVGDFVLGGRFVSGSAFGWESREDIAAAETAMAGCELYGYENRMMNELSGGERQRVVLARALATGANHLLLDEPTANLDLAHQASMLRLVRDRCRVAGCSAVVITHDINLAAEFADRIVMLDSGSMHVIGRPEEALMSESLRKVFGVDMLLDQNPVSGKVRATAIY